MLLQGDPIKCNAQMEYVHVIGNFTDHLQASFNVKGVIRDTFWREYKSRTVLTYNTETSRNDFARIDVSVHQI